VAQKSILLTFHGRRSGGTKTEAIGFSGEGCTAAMKQLADQMGATLDDVEHKPEYHAPPQQER
jgi:hypothetical protein